MKENDGIIRFLYGTVPAAAFSGWSKKPTRID